MGNEVEAMGAIEKAMDGLEDDEANRVLSWANAKFSTTNSGDGGFDPPEGGPNRFERIADLMDAANPSTGREYVLVAAYWFQVLDGEENFTGSQVNSTLKDLGHGASNITDAFNSLIARRFARQVQKSGTSKQARKRYRLTEEGIRQVEGMISGAEQE